MSTYEIFVDPSRVNERMCANFYLDSCQCKPSNILRDDIEIFSEKSKT